MVETLKKSVGVRENGGVEKGFGGFTTTFDWLTLDSIENRTKGVGHVFSQKFVLPILSSGVFR
jgi:hypothetical protein